MRSVAPWQQTSRMPHRRFEDPRWPHQNCGSKIRADGTRGYSTHAGQDDAGFDPPSRLSQRSAVRHDGQGGDVECAVSRVSLIFRAKGARSRMGRCAPWRTPSPTADPTRMASSNVPARLSFPRARPQHRRSSADGTKQPIWNEDRSVAVVFDHELVRLPRTGRRVPPAAWGHRFATHCDTEGRPASLSRPAITMTNSCPHAAGNLPLHCSMPIAAGLSWPAIASASVRCTGLSRPLLRGRLAPFRI